MTQLQKRSPIQDKNIAIIGAGPGGLILARLLQMNGASVKVYERDASPAARVQGATLNLNAGSGLDAIIKAGLMESFKKAYRPGADKMIFVDGSANILIDEADDSDGVESRPEIDRGPLRELLLASLDADTVVWDAQFLSLQRTGDGVELTFKNGKTALADLVIAADGANSKVRPYITSIAPVYSGVTVVEGAVHEVEKTMPQIHKLLNGGKICVLGNKKTLIIVLKGDDTVAFYTGHKAEPGWPDNCGIDFSDRVQVLGWFKKEFHGWNAMWDALIENASLPLIPRPQFCAPANQDWQSLPDLTMLGDAAHVMPPYAGEGVNMAMQDAMVLADNLLDPGFASMHAAIAAYEKEMRGRNGQTAKMTLEFTEAFHSSDPVPFFKEVFSAVVTNE
ncbi:FAD-dependent oxidoreductase [Undibacterium sp. TJN19]|uniref:FAD-dependent oxidoreductase n=1 Tax=Undibacterium sp. TJN19 TaxID=3413055 RepID=UPI003BF019FE